MWELRDNDESAQRNKIEPTSSKSGLPAVTARQGHNVCIFDKEAKRCNLSRQFSECLAAAVADICGPTLVKA
jgi:hypothetical protein